MNCPLRRTVLLTCALVAALQAHAAMQHRVPATSPKSIRVIVDGSNTIVADNGGGAGNLRESRGCGE